MSRRPTDAHLAAVAETLAEIEPAVEAARRNAHKVADSLPPHQRARATMFSLSAEACDRPGRIAAAVRAFGAPAALAAELTTAGLTVQQAHDMLRKAAGRERTLNAAGVQAIRLGLTQIRVEAMQATARADSDRTRAIGALLHDHGLVHTIAGARVASSKHEMATLRTLVQNRADRLGGHLSPAAQLRLLRDLAWTPTVKETS